MANSEVHDPLAELLLDAAVLARTTDEDFRLKFWSGWDDRRREFNELLDRSIKLGVRSTLGIIVEVPDGDRAFSGVGSDPERAKLREVSDAAARLLEHLRQAAGASGTALDSDDAAVISNVERLCERFHSVARQLRERHGARVTLDVVDEYDVQDLIHALLRIHFDDVRPEEHNPSYAGAASRMDFLLKRERCAVEVKKTRVGLGAKQVGEQLIVDVARYSAHPDCSLLICFVYDPEGRVSNPRGVESDLDALSSDTMRVRVLIRPRDVGA